jgi:hypothetical protein
MMKEWITYIILIDVRIGDAQDAPLVDRDLARLAGGIVAGALGERMLGVLRLCLIVSYVYLAIAMTILTW